ncbi:translocation/assembly module TamB domain-containing protein [Neosynechococcus sphagnicola]|uniref:translocation/assembly module TamB domain-containing protein n=1 Tax=Neosynechococcus sphagnicola TaxID=1501145 RepID=UPI00068FAFB4|nr:hypothetical protein [Neosynechococcus sphagnicola]
MIGRGQVTLGERGRLTLNFQGQGLPGDAIARAYGNVPGFTIGPIAAQAQIFGSLTPRGNPPPIQTVVQWQAPQAAYPATGTVTIAGDTTHVQNTRLQVAEGTVALQGQLQANGGWQAVADLGQLRLSTLSPQLRGQLNGQLQLSGSLETPGLEAVRAAGSLQFSQGLALINQPLSAQVRWDGRQIQVQQATAPGIQAQGVIQTRLLAAGLPQLTQLALNVKAHNFDLRTLPLANLPAPLRGTADFTGQVSGAIERPSVSGVLRLNQLMVNRVAFEPLLVGSLRYRPTQGLKLQVAGRQDRIALGVDTANRPTTFFIQRDQALAIGQTEGGQLRVQLQNLPLALLPLPQTANASFKTLGGQLNGNFLVNWNQETVAGEVAIAHPQLGRFTGDQFLGQFRYANGVAVLSSGEFRQGNSQYLLKGSYNLAGRQDMPQLQAQIQVTKGQIQDVLQALQWFELRDLQRGLQPPTYARAVDVQPVALGLPEATLQDQLRRFSEILALQDQQANQQQEAQIPPLEALKGNFSGTIQVAGSLQTGVNLDFNLQGQNWQWETYKVNQITANGRLENGKLLLRPLQLQSGDALLTFTGQLGGSQQSGELLAQNLPLADLQKAFRLPVNLTGKLSGVATLAGSIENPQAAGTLEVLQGTLNSKAIQSAQGNFNYQDARLNFGSQVVIAGPEPIRIAGNFPLKLPFAKVAPHSQDISLNLDVKNEGLGLLNVLTPQVNWVEGRGQLQLQLQGTLEEPIATGIAQLQGATLKAQALPAPLTGVTGTIRFDRDRIVVEKLQGQFSQGQVIAQGILPLANPVRTLTNPPCRHRPSPEHFPPTTGSQSPRSLSRWSQWSIDGDRIRAESCYSGGASNWQMDKFCSWILPVATATTARAPPAPAVLQA